MNVRRIACVVGVCLFAFASSAVAQLPLPIPPQGNTTGQRPPDKTVEGIIFEYEGALDAASKAKGEDKPFGGRFRLEKTAIFDISPTIKLPSKAEVEKVAKDVLSGDPGKIKLPEAPQQKRLGQFTKTGSDKLRLEFDNKEALVGTMLLFKDKSTADVWNGTFTERKDGRPGRVWKVKARPVED